MIDENLKLGDKMVSAWELIWWFPILEVKAHYVLALADDLLGAPWSWKLTRKQYRLIGKKETV